MNGNEEVSWKDSVLINYSYDQLRAQDKDEKVHVTSI